MLWLKNPLRLKNTLRLSQNNLRETWSKISHYKLPKKKKNPKKLTSAKKTSGTSSISARLSDSCCFTSSVSLESISRCTGINISLLKSSWFKDQPNLSTNIFKLTHRRNSHLWCKSSLLNKGLSSKSWSSLSLWATGIIKERRCLQIPWCLSIKSEM